MVEKERGGMAKSNFLLVCLLDFNVFCMLLYIHINLLFAFLPFFHHKRYGAGFGGKHGNFKT